MRFHRQEVHDTKAWSDLINSIMPMDQRYRDAAPWHAGLTVQETPAYRLLRWWQRGERTAYRTPSQIRRCPGDEHYWVVVPRAGVYSLWRDGERTRVPPGFGAVMLLNESCRMHIPTTDVHAFQVPRAEIDKRVEPGGPLRVVLDLRSGLGRIVRDLVQNVHAEEDVLSDREFNAVCDRIGELLGMLTLGDMRPQQAHMTEVETVTRQYVRERIGTAELRLPSVARALGWSPRQLRFVLRQNGMTFRELRQEESLRRARDILRDPESRSVTISEIAARIGFTSTWFSAAFKARYGETPRDFRHRSLAEYPADSAYPCPDTS